MPHTGKPGVKKKCVNVLFSYFGVPLLCGLLDKPLFSSVCHRCYIIVVLCPGIKESDTGLAPPAMWDLQADKIALQQEQPLQVARCTKIINSGEAGEEARYIINVKQFAKFVVELSERVAPTDIEEGMRVG